MHINKNTCVYKVQISRIPLYNDDEINTIQKELKKFNQIALIPLKIKKLFFILKICFMLPKRFNY